MDEKTVAPWLSSPFCHFPVKETQWQNSPYSCGTAPDFHRIPHSKPITRPFLSYKIVAVPFPWAKTLNKRRAEILPANPAPNRRQCLDLIDYAKNESLILKITYNCILSSFFHSATGLFACFTSSVKRITCHGEDVYLAVIPVEHPFLSSLR
mgnify:CR=1 FL=1